METKQDRHKAIIRYIHDQVNKGNLDVFAEHIGPNYVRHCQAMPPGFQEIKGIKPLLGFVKECLAAFPDWHDEIDYIIAEGDRVAYQTTSTATQTGPMGPLPASGKSMRLQSIISHRFEKEKIVETWITWDNVAFLAQLGHMPESPF
jgi:steroid delta-isomerase-like uncharacterized protein